MDSQCFCATCLSAQGADMGQESQAEGLAQLKARFPEEDDRILDAFLYVKSYNVDDAITHYEVRGMADSLLVQTLK